MFQRRTVGGNLANEHMCALRRLKSDSERKRNGQFIIPGQGSK
jgi:hypothetical protein